MPKRSTAAETKAHDVFAYQHEGALSSFAHRVLPFLRFYAWRFFTTMLFIFRSLTSFEGGVEKRHAPAAKSGKNIASGKKGTVAKKIAKSKATGAARKMAKTLSQTKAGAARKGAASFLPILRSKFICSIFGIRRLVVAIRHDLPLSR